MVRRLSRSSSLNQRNELTRIFAVSEFTRRLRHLLDALILKIGRQQMVIPGSGRVGWQEKFKTIVGAPIRKRHAGKQDNAIQVNLMALLQNARQLRRTRCAVALANQILRRSPALVTRDVLINEVCEPVRVLDDA